MHVAIRVDASLIIGTGHVMRCLALGGLLARRGAVVLFVCRETPGHLCDQIAAEGYPVARIPVPSGDGQPLDWHEDARSTLAAIDARGAPLDLLVVDHYGLDRSWESVLRTRAARLLVIDDLADRPHDCDVLLDQSLHDEPALRYRDRVPTATKLFLGPRFALLRAEFDAVPVRVRDGVLRRLLVFFGGADPTNEALTLVQALRVLGTRAPRTQLVLGPVNPHAATVRAAAAGVPGLEVIDSTREMARLIAAADLGIGTCGGAAWERCALGLPTLVVVSADNQRDDARLLERLGAVRNLGDAGAVAPQRWVEELTAFAADPVALRRMSDAAAAVMADRRGAIGTLVDALVA